MEGGSQKLAYFAFVFFPKEFVLRFEGMIFHFKMHLATEDVSRVRLKTARAWNHKVVFSAFVAKVPSNFDVNALSLTT